MSGRVLSATVSVLVLTLAVRKGETQRPDNCLRRFTSGGIDCGTVDDICAFVVNDVPQRFPDPPENFFECYRTCYADGECFADRIRSRRITRIVDNPMITSMKINSPNYRSEDSDRIGNYRGSTVCLYHIKCDGSKLLYYSVNGQQLQERASCQSGPNSCVDRLRIRVPNLGECTRCGSIADAGNQNCPSRSGLGNEMIVEFVANRQDEQTGMEMFINCQRPGIDQSFSITSNPLRGLRIDSIVEPQEDCTSPEGTGPRDAPAIPPPAERLQRVLDGDPNADYRILEGPDDVVTYTDNTIQLITSANGLEIFPNVNSLVVESPFDLRQYFRIAPRSLAGFAQFVVSENEAFMVQFGVNPNFMPTEEEAMAASLMDSAISDAVADVDLFDVFDDLDLMEQTEIVTATQPPDEERSKRGVDGDFINALALEYGNACNGVLRTTACVYQELVLGRDCFTGQPI